MFVHSISRQTNDPQHSMKFVTVTLSSVGPNFTNQPIRTPFSPLNLTWVHFSLLGRTLAHCLLDSCLVVKPLKLRLIHIVPPPSHSKWFVLKSEPSRLLNSCMTCLSCIFLDLIQGLSPGSNTKCCNLCYMESEADTWKRKRFVSKNNKKRIRVGSIYIYIYII